MNKLLKTTLAVLLLATTALQAQIEINDNISVTGFVDMSVSKTDSEMTRSTSNSAAVNNAADADGSSGNLIKLKSTSSLTSTKSAVKSI